MTVAVVYSGKGQPEMHIEIFHAEKPSTPEEIAQFQELSEKAGVKGQQKLFSELKEHPKLQEKQRRLYESLLPNVVAVESYEADLLPSEILTEIGSAKLQSLYDEGMFIRWGGDEARGLHVLLGHRKVPGQSYGQFQFLMALWGENKPDYKKLVPEAIKKKKAQMKGSFLRTRDDADSALKTLDESIERWFEGDYISHF